MDRLRRPRGAGPACADRLTGLHGFSRCLWQERQGRKLTVGAAPAGREIVRATGDGRRELAPFAFAAPERRPDHAAADQCVGWVDSSSRQRVALIVARNRAPAMSSRCSSHQAEVAQFQSGGAADRGGVCARLQRANGPKMRNHVTWCMEGSLERTRYDRRA
jgi:hypothetical protein